MRRREFITLLGVAAFAWSPATSAQQSTMPVIGFLESLTKRFLGHVSQVFRLRDFLCHTRC